MPQVLTQAVDAPKPPVPDAFEPSWRPSLRVAGRAFVGALAVPAGAIGLGFAFAAMKIGESAMPVVSGITVAATFVLCAWALLRSLVALGQMGLAKEPVGFRPPLTALGLGTMSLFGMFVGLMGLFGMSRGRQLRRRGRVMLPRLGPGGAWARLGLEADIPGPLRAALAARWRENGRNEHASVAAFARLTLDLMALGAPPELIASANRDALEEIRHAELCFSIAKALDGRDGGPAPFPEAQSARTLPANRTLALAKLAVDSLVDGALNEGLSARIIARMVRRCEVPAIRRLLRELAKDEARHCAHGWEVVEWCLREGGAPVAQALRGAAAMIPRRPPTELPIEAQGGRWEAYGIHGLALEREQHRLCREGLERRLASLLN